ncbi:MAG: YidC/Oxa1 family insertase periplasmic-domain containing protein [Planctomycetota bacterium]
MPRKPNTALRVAIPLIAGVVAIVFVIAVATQSGPKNNPPAPAQSAAESLVEAAPDQDVLDQDATPPTPQLVAEPTPDPVETVAEAAPEQPADTDTLIETPDDAAEQSGAPTYRVRPVTTTQTPGTLGSIEAGTRGVITFSSYGAGIESLRLTGYTDLVGQDPENLEDLVEVQSQTVRDFGSGPVAATPLAALRIEVDGQEIPLGRSGLWSADPQRPGSFSAVIETEDQQPVLRITRRFNFEPDAYDFVLEQRITNLDSQPHTVRWVQAGPTDMRAPTLKYAGDKRRVRFGTIPSPGSPVRADEELQGRTKLAKGDAVESVWTDGGTDERLSWFAFTDRYFAVAIHPIYDTGDPDARRNLAAVQSIQRLILQPALADEEEVIVSQLTSPALPLQPGASANLSMGVYAGPLDKDTIREVPRLAALNLDEIVTYNIGGFCAEFCTAGWMTSLLVTVMAFFESLVNDWALSIILLVLTVRGILHPLTRFVQTRMARFGAQMQVIGPKMKQVQEKYKPQPGDAPDVKMEKQKKLQSEIGALFREEGVNPAQVLGCLPMFLQSPVWIALYSSLYFFFPMRHEAAFFGVFQQLGGWPFLADLAQPDRAIPLPFAVNIPLLSGIWGEVTAINVLPLLMGVVFWAHQKYMTPQTASTMSPEQEAQMKLMKVMSIGMFPIFMYNAPSALTIYFVTNSTIAIFESRWIRAQAKAKGLLDPEKIREESKRRRAAKKAKGGFMDRLKTQAETYQQMKAQQQAQQDAQRRKVQNTAKDTPGRYKKRR